MILTDRLKIMCDSQSQMSISVQFGIKVDLEERAKALCPLACGHISLTSLITVNPF